MINGNYMECVSPQYKESFILYNQGKKLGAYSSHQPVLIHTLNTITKGNVVEFGMGFHSTILMHIICAFQGRNLLSLDNEKEWLDKFIHYRSDKHSIELMTELPKFNKKDKIAVAFVDGGLPRQPFIDLMQPIADYIIVHDTEMYVKGTKDVYNYDFSGFKHVLHYKNALPMTSLLSNLDVVDSKLLSVFE